MIARISGPKIDSLLVSGALLSLTLLDPVILSQTAVPGPSHFFVLMLIVRHARVSRTRIINAVTVVSILGLLTLSAAFASPSANSIFELMRVAYYLVIAASIISFFRCRPSSVGSALKTQLLASLGVSVFAYLVFFEPGQRLSLGDGFNPTWLAFYCVVGCVCSMFFIRSGLSAFFAALNVVALGWFLYIIFLTQGQTSLFSAALFIMIASLSFSGVIFILVAAAIVLPNLQNILDFAFDFTLQYAPRVHRTLFRFNDHSLDYVSSGRTEIARRILDQPDAHTMLGRGIGTSNELIGVTPHNAYISVYVDFGLVGLIIFLVGFAYIGWHLAKAPIGAALVALHASLMLGNDMLYYKFWYILVICTAAVYFSHIHARSTALSHRFRDSHGAPIPRVTDPTTSVTGIASAVKPFRTTIWTRNSAT